MLAMLAQLGERPQFILARGMNFYGTSVTQRHGPSLEGDTRIKFGAPALPAGGGTRSLRTWPDRLGPAGGRGLPRLSGSPSSPLQMERGWDARASLHGQRAPAARVGSPGLPNILLDAPPPAQALSTLVRALPPRRRPRPGEFQARVTGSGVPPSHSCPCPSRRPYPPGRPHRPLLPASVPAFSAPPSQRVEMGPSPCALRRAMPRGPGP